MMKKPENPFPTTSYLGARYFCNRESETRQLLGDLINGQSVTLTSIRRIGKTGLIHHVLGQLPSSHMGIYADLLATENLNGFFNTLATAAIQRIPEVSSPGKKLWQLIRSFRPVITMDPMTGFPQVSVDFRPAETNHHIDTLLKFLNSQSKKVVIALDEFQQILHYPEKNADAWLRGIIQTLTNITFVFSGSQQHLMMELFSRPSRPFYRSTGFLRLSKISSEEYSIFIQQKFREYGRTISVETAEEILDWTQGHTYYVQLVCNRVFRSVHKQITKEVWSVEAYQLLKEQELVFINYRDLLTNHQWNLLKAIASEETVSAPTSREFIEKYRLGNPSTILRSLKTLLQAELIYKDYTPETVTYYSVYDMLFLRWVQHHVPNR